MKCYNNEEKDGINLEITLSEKKNIVSKFEI